MATQAPLAGISVLIVEDDFFLAMDEQYALEDVGARIIGPCSSEAQGLLAADGVMDCAVLDLNLGTGPSFGIAAALRARDIPFLFVTGYDADVIPAEFMDVVRLQKPIIMSELIGALCTISGK